MVMSQKKAADDLEVKKQELSMKMKSSTTFFCLPMQSADKGFLTPITTSPDVIGHHWQSMFVNEEQSK